MSVHELYVSPNHPCFLSIKIMLVALTTTAWVIWFCYNESIMNNLSTREVYMNASDVRPHIQNKEATMERRLLIVSFYAIISYLPLIVIAVTCKVGQRVWSRHYIVDEISSAKCTNPKVCVNGKVILIFAGDPGKAKC